jgi:hypothetical protein
MENNQQPQGQQPYAQPEQPVYAQPQYEQQAQPQPQYDYTYAQYEPQPAPVSKKNGIISMILGIASLVGFESGILSLVCAIIGLVMSKKAAAAGDTSGFAKAGKITSTVGLILSIVAIAAIVIAVIVWIIVLLTAGGAAYSQGVFDEIFR